MKQFIYTDDDLNKRRKKKGADRIVVNSGNLGIGGPPFIDVQLQWCPLPWIGVSKGGKVETFRLTLEQVDEFIEILKSVKARIEAREKKETKNGIVGVSEYNPNGWNEFPAVIPPSGRVLMLLEVEGDRFDAWFDGEEWFTPGGTPIETEYATTVRFRPSNKDRNF